VDLVTSQHLLRPNLGASEQPYMDKPLCALLHVPRLCAEQAGWVGRGVCKQVSAFCAVLCRQAPSLVRCRANTDFCSPAAASSRRGFPGSVVWRARHAAAAGGCRRGGRARLLGVAGSGAVCTRGVSTCLVCLRSGAGGKDVRVV